MDYKRAQSLPQIFFQQAEKLDKQPLLWAKAEGRYQPWTWSQVRHEVVCLANALARLGITAGDRVLLVSENRPEWFIADFAIMSLGAITVPAYTSNQARDHLHLLTDSGACAAIVSKRVLAAPLQEALRQLPQCPHLISMEPLQDPSGTGGPPPLAWHSLIEKSHEDERELAARVAEIQREDLACLIYTSGTGGTPKGVMLSHGNILANCLSAFDLLEEYGLGHEIFLSFLPLSHSYEHTAGHVFPMTIGAEVYYAEALDALQKNLTEVRPTVMTAVPRLYEAMYQRINRGLRKEPAYRQRLFAAAERLGRKRYEDPSSLTLWERLYDRLLEHLVRDKVRQRFGGRLKAMISGGAPLNPEVGLFFHALGLRILQGYGLTESAPVISANRPHRIKMHTVGPPLKGVEVKVAEDGEILVRGELVMRGYWNNPQASQEAVRDNWLHTGDIGSIDQDGYITITDRKKDIIVLSGGENISPAHIEGSLTLQPEINQAIVVGDHRPHLVALIVPDENWLKSWARTAKKPADLAALAQDRELRRAIAASLERVNAELPSIERIRRFLILPEPFSVENAMLTPTLKIRRHVIKNTYGPQIEALFRK